MVKVRCIYQMPSSSAAAGRGRLASSVTALTFAVGVVDEECCLAALEEDPEDFILPFFGS